MSDLADEIRELPAATQGTISGNKRNDRLREVIRKKAASDPWGVVGFVHCREPIPDEFSDWALPLDPPVIVDHLLAWLAKHPDAGLDGFASYIEFAQRPTRHDSLPGKPPCTPFLKMDPGWRIDELEAEAAELAESSDEPTDSAFWLPTVTVGDLKSRPGLLAALGLVIVGGLVIAPVTPIGLLLCPKSTAIQCPDDPTKAGEEQPATSDPSGGDR